MFNKNSRQGLKLVAMMGLVALASACESPTTSSGAGNNAEVLANVTSGNILMSINKTASIAAVSSSSHAPPGVLQFNTSRACGDGDVAHFATGYPIAAHADVDFVDGSLNSTNTAPKVPNISLVLGYWVSPSDDPMQVPKTGSIAGGNWQPIGYMPANADVARALQIGTISGGPFITKLFRANKPEIGSFASPPAGFKPKNYEAAQMLYKDMTSVFTNAKKAYNMPSTAGTALKYKVYAAAMLCTPNPTSGARPDQFPVVTGTGVGSGANGRAIASEIEDALAAPPSGPNPGGLDSRLSGTWDIANPPHVLSYYQKFDPGSNANSVEVDIDDGSPQPIDPSLSLIGTYDVAGDALYDMGKSTADAVVAYDAAYKQYQKDLKQYQKDLAAYNAAVAAAASASTGASSSGGSGGGGGGGGGSSGGGGGGGGQTASIPPQPVAPTVPGLQDPFTAGNKADLKQVLADLSTKTRCSEVYASKPDMIGEKARWYESYPMQLTCKQLSGLGVLVAGDGSIILSKPSDPVVDRGNYVNLAQMLMRASLMKWAQNAVIDSGKAPTIAAAFPSAGVSCIGAPSVPMYHRVVASIPIPLKVVPTATPYVQPDAQLVQRRMVHPEGSLAIYYYPSYDGDDRKSVFGMQDYATASSIVGLPAWASNEAGFQPWNLVATPQPAIPSIGPNFLGVALSASFQIRSLNCPGYSVPGIGGGGYGTFYCSLDQDWLPAARSNPASRRRDL